MTQSSIRDAIILTLFQASRFCYPLTSAQLWQRLLADSKIKKSDFLIVLNQLIASGTICEQNNYLSLIYSNINVRSFKNRQRQAEKKRAQIKKLLAHLNHFSLVRGVAITGSVAIGNARCDDDVDFLIITSPHALYIARLWLVILSTFCAHKRTCRVGTTQRDQWCFNLWLTTASLRIPRSRQTLYSAYEFLQADFVIDKDQVREQFWQANSDWLTGILPNTTEKNTKLNSNAAKKLLDTKKTRNFILNFTNNILFNLQYAFMHRKMTRELVTRQQAFFHPRPTRLMDKKDLINQHQVFLGTLKTAGDQLPPAVLETLARARHYSQVVVLVTGVFDLLHTGHLEFLQLAAKLGDVLLIGIESDVRARAAKGKTRPLHEELVRLGRVQKLNLAQHVFILPENFGDANARAQFLQTLAPDILAVSLHCANLAAKKKLTAALGIELIIVPVEKNLQVSTTAILAGRVPADQLLFSEDQQFVKKNSL